jgi:hypothetical protein
LRFGYTADRLRSARRTYSSRAFRCGFERPLAPGWHLLAAPFADLTVDRISVREPWLQHKELEPIVRSGKLGSELVAIDLKDHERALVSIDGRLNAICGPGVRALWQVDRTVKVEVVDARQQPFVHADLPVVLTARGASELLETSVVPAGWAGLLFEDGRLIGRLAPGLHAFWKGERKIVVMPLDLREQTLDISGQERNGAPVGGFDGRPAGSGEPPPIDRGGNRAHT